MSRIPIALATLLLTVVALADSPPVPGPTVPQHRGRDPSVKYMLPSVSQLTGQAECLDFPPPPGSQKPGFMVNRQDPVTKDFYGEIFVTDRCREPPGQPDTWNVGCADIVWDQTGTILSLTIRWQRQYVQQQQPDVSLCMTDVPTRG